MMAEGQSVLALRALARLPKSMTTVTGWRQDRMTPRLSPFPKGRPAPPGGYWRSLFCQGGSQNFLLLAQVQENREDYRAWLCVQSAGTWQVLVRLEYHGNHPGLHVHDWCGVPQPPGGAQSIEMPNKRPRQHLKGRQRKPLTKGLFWTYALNLFRIDAVKQQEELW
jgi:hypothetical protein